MTAYTYKDGKILKYDVKSKKWTESEINRLKRPKGE